MINLTEDLVEQIARQDRKLANDIIGWLTAPVVKANPSQWCEKNVSLRTTTIKAQFSLRGREYLREPINDIADDDLHFQTCCWGTGCAKTVKNIGQMMFVFENDPSSMLYVVPTVEGQGGARELNNSAIIPTVKATACFRSKMPVGGNARHNLTGMRCVFGGNILNLAGANSPGQLAGPRRRIVWLDESDKFKEQLGREASADYLANERTKQVQRSKLIRNSTPSLEDFGIWPHLMASDLRRRFLPCPSCRKRFVLIHSQQYTVLKPKTQSGDQIYFAELTWDKESRRKDDSWDYDRLIRSTRFECPHCKFHMLDHHREWMDKNGIWIPTIESASSHKGYHLPSFYAPHIDFESSWGGMAKKFVDSTETGQGMRGYINSELAEVDSAQEHSQAAIELSSTVLASSEWHPLMVCDFQKLYPYIWFVVSRWSSFKLQPEFEFAGDVPVIAGKLEGPLKAKCETIVAGRNETWKALAAILRFDNRVGEFPLLDFLIAQKIVGPKLTRLFLEVCGGNAVEIGRWIYREMGKTVPKGGDSEIICAGHCEASADDAWIELRDIQHQFRVGESIAKWGMSPNRAVMIDAGYMEEHNPEVLRKCFESNGDNGRWQWYDPTSKKFIPHKIHAFCRPAPMDCWVPYRGLPIANPGKFRAADGIGRNWKLNPDDPFKGLNEAGKCAIEVLESASEFYFHMWMDSRDSQKDIRQAISEGKPYRGNVWSVSDNCEFYPLKKFTPEMFHAQLNSKGRNADGEIWERGTGGGGKRRHPDHLNDCCVNAYPLAEAHGFFSYETKQPTKK